MANESLRMSSGGLLRSSGANNLIGRHIWMGRILYARRRIIRGPQSPSIPANPSTQDQSAAEHNSLIEAERIANLIWARVTISGEQIQRTAAERTAPADLIANIHLLLQASPLVCYLCRGVMQIKPANRLFQPSPDRIDSSIPDYGPGNLRLAHLACNLGKNASSVAEFDEWLNLIRSSDSSIPRD